jgi:hypothetical protein
MCQPAPVVNRFGQDVAERFLIPAVYNQPGQGGVFLGSVGDQAHSTRRSSHNCAGAPGGQEDGAYAPNFAHAWDCRPVNSDVGYALVQATLADPRVRYVLYADHGWYPDGTFEDITDNDQFDLDHDTFHVSFKPGTHNDTRPFFTDTDEGEFTVADISKIVEAINEAKRSNIRQHQKDRKQQSAIAVAQARRDGANTDDLILAIDEASEGDD